jgi:hypothetical protein
MKVIKISAAVVASAAVGFMIQNIQNIQGIQNLM